MIVYIVGFFLFCGSQVIFPFTLRNTICYDIPNSRMNFGFAILFLSIFILFATFQNFSMRVSFHNSTWKLFLWASWCAQEVPKVFYPSLWRNIILCVRNTLSLVYEMLIKIFLIGTEFKELCVWLKCWIFTWIYIVYSPRLVLRKLERFHFVSHTNQKLT